jgi:ribonuclease P protein component
VTRNRVRRRLQHLCADRLGALPAGSILVVRALPPAAAADSALLGRELDAALKRLTGGGAEERARAERRGGKP